MFVQTASSIIAFYFDILWSQKGHKPDQLKSVTLQINRLHDVIFWCCFKLLHSKQSCGAFTALYLLLFF